MDIHSFSDGICFACISRLFTRVTNQIVQDVFTITCDVVFNYPFISICRNERVAFLNV